MGHLYYSIGMFQELQVHEAKAIQSGRWRTGFGHDLGYEAMHIKFRFRSPRPFLQLGAPHQLQSYPGLCQQHGRQFRC